MAGQVCPLHQVIAEIGLHNYLPPKVHRAALEVTRSAAVESRTDHMTLTDTQ